MAKKTAEKKTVYPIEVQSSTRVRVTRERNSANEWDQDDLDSDTTIIGVKPGSSDWYTEVTSPFPLEKGSEYYLVYVVYSTGDSFHRESGRVAYIDLFIDSQKAEQCARDIQDHYNLTGNAARWKPNPVKPPKGYSEYRVSYTNEVGEVVSIAPSWTGYFEILTNIVVKKVVAIFSHGDNIPKDDGLIRYEY